MKHVYFFARHDAQGTLAQRDVLGNKGANLHEMARLGLPVPPGFTISAEVSGRFQGRYPKGLKGEVAQALARLEAATGKRFGEATNPLLLSVRSGAAASMPGMMDTVLNLGLNPETLAGLAERTGNARFAWDAYRRLVQMYGDVVAGVPHARFEAALSARKRARGVTLDTELDAADLEGLAAEFEAIYQDGTGRPFPRDPRVQLWGAIEAVFRSWNAPRAATYRRIHGMDAGTLGTAVNVQAMVFGNLGAGSASGVAFSRNPATGEPGAYGEFLLNAQGEDVVAGIRTPEPLERMAQTLPEAHARLLRLLVELESHFRDLQDVEFTVEGGTLYLLQTRNGKRTPRAAVRVAVELVGEGLIARQDALRRVTPRQLELLLHRRFAPDPAAKPLARGLAASPGAAVGRAVFSAAEAERRAQAGEAVVLVRQETSPDDVGGMQAAQGVLTARGGFTSHAAIVARGMGKPCVAGCEALAVDVEARRFSVDGQTVREGDWVSIDGASGEVFAGRRALEDAELDDRVDTLLGWADAARKLGVWANADTPEDARRALAFGAEGIGLARTEHMFFGAERLRLFQEAIVGPSPERARALLDRLRTFQQADVEALLATMDGKPVVVRLLDPPLHEFLPKGGAELAALAKTLKLAPEALRGRVDALREVNPMLGHRGCRLGLTHPEIYAMQVEAIARAAAALRRAGRKPRPHIMVPLVGSEAEMAKLKGHIDAVLQREGGQATDIPVGTMIEVPRACLVADRLARHAAFFSFGTNDLTQLVYGFSRDDAASFLDAYRQLGALDGDPFVSLDPDGVGALVRLAVERGRKARPEMSLGLCGEHGGDAASIALCHRLGLDYVSASPFRLPLARLAAAQAALDDRVGQRAVAA